MPLDIHQLLNRDLIEVSPLEPQLAKVLELQKQHNAFVATLFDVDANGILNVTAKDKGTGKEQKIRIEASSGLSDEEIKKMKEEAEANAESDKAAKEEADKINAADALVFSTEKQLKEYGDKIPADKKGAIETSLNKLKEAHKNQDIPAIDAAMAEMNTAWTAASEEIYKAQQAAGPEAGAAGPDAAAGGAAVD